MISCFLLDCQHQRAHISLGLGLFLPLLFFPLLLLIFEQPHFLLGLVEGLVARKCSRLDLFLKEGDEARDVFVSAQADGLDEFDHAAFMLVVVVDEVLLLHGSFPVLLLEAFDIVLGDLLVDCPEVFVGTLEGFLIEIISHVSFVRLIVPV